MAFFYSSVGHGGATGYLAALSLLGVAPASARVAVLLALGLGAALGFLAGLAGIGGGVFLSPVLYLFRWMKPKTTGGIAAGFIVVNSLAGLIGAGAHSILTAGPLLWLTLPAVGGAWLGPHLGARRWSSVTFSRVLAGVLVFAGGKLLLEAAG